MKCLKQQKLLDVKKIKKQKPKEVEVSKRQKLTEDSKNQSIKKELKQRKSIENKEKRKFTDMLDELDGDFTCDEKKEYGVCIHTSKKGAKKSAVVNAPTLKLLGRKLEKFLVDLIRWELEVTFQINRYKNILVVGLGNSEIVNDSLGPDVLKKLLVSRGLDIKPQLGAIATDVYSNTGIESADTVKAFCDLIVPDLVIFIDSLATISVDRLCSSFQIANDSIQAGSGLNKNNKKLTKKILKCDILSIGVPTLISAQNFYSECECGCKDCRNRDSESSKMEDLILTPCDSKKIIELLSDIISQALNNSIFNQFTADEINQLIK
jgi:hypothetical protein